MPIQFDPQKPLPNRKHEAFVQALLDLEPVPAAYVTAGYLPNPNAAARLVRQAHIQARFQAVMEILSRPIPQDAAGLAARVREELEAMARGERRAVKEMVFESVDGGPNKLVGVTYY